MEGTPFGRFRLLESLKKTDYHESWRALDDDGRDVVVRILRVQSSADFDYVKRFRRDARVAAWLDHPHIVPVIDTGEVGDRPFLVTPWIEGADLKMLLSDGPLSAERAVSIVDQIAWAVDDGHEAGLVHRGITRSNVIVDGDGVARLSDFGAARGPDLGDPEATSSPAGFAPELFVAGHSDELTDVYALTHVLFYCLTGREPFRGNVKQQRLDHMTAPPPRPSSEREDLPKRIDVVIATGMAKDPALRYRTAGELADAAHGALGVDPAPYDVDEPDYEDWPAEPAPPDEPKRKRRFGFRRSRAAEPHIEPAVDAEDVPFPQPDFEPELDDEDIDVPQFLYEDEDEPVPEPQPQPEPAAPKPKRHFGFKRSPRPEVPLDAEPETTAIPLPEPDPEPEPPPPPPEFKPAWHVGFARPSEPETPPDTEPRPEPVPEPEPAFAAEPPLTPEPAVTDPYPEPEPERMPELGRKERRKLRPKHAPMPPPPPKTEAHPLVRRARRLVLIGGAVAVVGALVAYGVVQYTGRHHPPPGAIDGMYTAQLGSTTTLNGMPTDTYADTITIGVAVRSACTDNGCVAIVKPVGRPMTDPAGIEKPSSTEQFVLDSIDDRWVSVEAASGENLANQWRVLSLRGVEDGGFRGTLSYFSDGSGLQRPVILTRKGDLEKGEMPEDPASLPPRQKSPAQSLRGTYTLTSTRVDVTVGELKPVDRLSGLKTYTNCLRNGEECFSTLTDESGTGILLDYADTAWRFKRDREQGCDGGGTTRSVWTFRLPVPADTPDPAQRLAGKGHIENTGACELIADTDVALERTGD